jgi:hypothetical protein
VVGTLVRNWLLLACIFEDLARQIEVTHLVIRRRAVPHVSLRISEEFSNRILRVREGIEGDLAGFLIQMSKHILIERGIPDVIVRIDPKSIGSWAKTGQLVFFEHLCFGIEPIDLARVVLANPNNLVRINFDPSRERVVKFLAIRRGVIGHS